MPSKKQDTQQNRHNHIIRLGALASLVLNKYIY